VAKDVAAVRDNAIEVLSWRSRGQDADPADVALLASALAQSTSLRKLDLGDSGLRDDDMRTLARALSGNRTLLSLDLRQNYITCRGARALARALPSTRIEQLVLRRNLIADEGALALLEMGCQKGSPLRSLNLSRNGVSADGFASIGGLLVEHAETAALLGPGDSFLSLARQTTGFDFELKDGEPTERAPVERSEPDQMQNSMTTRRSASSQRSGPIV
jgi:hypothetical protein